MVRIITRLPIFAQWPSRRDAMYCKPLRLRKSRFLTDIKTHGQFDYTGRNLDPCLMLVDYDFPYSDRRWRKGEKKFYSRYGVATISSDGTVFHLSSPLTWVLKSILYGKSWLIIIPYVPYIWSMRYDGHMKGCSKFRLDPYDTKIFSLII